MDLNKVFLIGRLVDNPEIRTTPSGRHVGSLRVATNRVWNDANGQRQERTEYHNVVVWQRMAEIASQYLQKGSLVLIEGRLETRSWQDASGTTKYRTEIIAERLQLGPRGGTTPPQENKALTEQEPTNEGLPPKEEIPIIDEDEEIDVKDIPF